MFVVVVVVVEMFYYSNKYREEDTVRETENQLFLSRSGSRKHHKL